MRIGELSCGYDPRLSYSYIKNRLLATLPLVIWCIDTGTLANLVMHLRLDCLILRKYHYCVFFHLTHKIIEYITYPNETNHNTST